MDTVIKQNLTYATEEARQHILNYINVIGKEYGLPPQILIMILENIIAQSIANEYRQTLQALEQPEQAAVEEPVLENE